MIRLMISMSPMIARNKNLNKIIYQTKGVCSRQIELEIEDDIIKSCKFYGGCSGNTQGVSVLVLGMDVDTAISKLEGIKCGFRETSCPDQLATALKQYKNK